MRIVFKHNPPMSTDSATPALRTLETLAIGQAARIADITGPRALRHRLLGLGLHPGGLLKIVQRRGRGMVVAVGATRIALDNSVACQLLVDEAV